MRLISIQIFANGAGGWESDVLALGKHITHLHGPNGCGKTPVIQSIVFCLGYDTEFRKGIYDHCSQATLTVEINGVTYRFTRQYSRDFDLSIESSDGQEGRYFSEATWSDFFFGLFGREREPLVSNRNKVAHAYVSTVLPLFYLDQDLGYSRIYSPPSSFIKDQFSESVRFAFRIPPRNPYDAKRWRLEAKTHLEPLDRMLKEKEMRMKAAQDHVASHELSPDQIKESIDLLSRQMSELKSVGSTRDDSVQVLDNMISSQGRELFGLATQLEDISKRRAAIDSIAVEIESEISALSLNEEARRVFRSLDEVCANPTCQLFLASTDAYGKNLLYLKDQLKDLQRSDAEFTADAARLQSRVKEIEATRTSARKRREDLLEGSEMASVIAAVTELNNEIFRLQGLMQDSNNFERAQVEYFDVLTRRNAAFDKYSAIGSASSSSPALAELRADIRKRFLLWLDVLSTPNVSRDITFQGDFTPLLGDEKVSQLTGSTKVRTVLAYHATLIELLAARDSNLRFLILDTPKQHEIHNDDLDRYFQALKKVCVEYDLQVVFSTTEYKYAGDSKDSTWQPTHPGEEQLMFLRQH